jgi:DNA modification methylase
MSKPIEFFINKNIRGDCLEVMRTMPDESIDIVIREWRN